MVSSNYYSRYVLSSLLGVLFCASGAFAACPFMSGLFSGGMGEDDAKMPADHHHHQFLRRMEPSAADGLLNEGKGCWGHCDKTAGDCDYCGTGQCCREVDFRNGIEGCETAQGISGARCGNWRNSNLEPTLRNEGLSCWGACDDSAGDCDYCGNGQCCRRVDGDRCVPGCELAATTANWIDGPGSQCGYFKDETTPCEPTVSAPPANNNDNQDQDRDHRHRNLWRGRSDLQRKCGQTNS